MERWPMTQAQRKATETAIAAKPCPVIFAIGIGRPSLDRLMSNSVTTEYPFVINMYFRERV